MIKLYNNYINTFKGLSKEVWWLALITLINRAGTMVIPFLSLYLTEDLKFTYNDVAWIMSAFGLGSVGGTWLGGKLTDTFGFYKVMVRSLLATGILFISLQFLHTFTTICIGIFLTMLVADTFRPAMYVAMSAYSKPENKIRSVTLIRLAINLGYSAGPFAGGLISAGIGYSGLFWIDGITCILATLLLIKVLNPRVSKTIDKFVNENPQSIYRDRPFWIFFFAMLIFAAIFFQYFSAIPLYYKDIHLLNKIEIGLLLSSNGIFIFLFEMPLISWLENSKFSKVSLIIFGVVLTALSFLVLTLTSWTGILIVGMLFMTIGEMISFPFSNSYVIDLAKKGNQGEYMAMYVMSFSIASVFGFNAGLQIISGIGFNKTWLIMSILGALCALLLLYLKTYSKRKQLT